MYLGDIASVATLVLFIFYFIGRAWVIIKEKVLIRETFGFENIGFDEEPSEEREKERIIMILMAEARLFQLLLKSLFSGWKSFQYSIAITGLILLPKEQLQLLSIKKLSNRIAQFSSEQIFQRDFLHIKFVFVVLTI